MFHEPTRRFGAEVDAGGEDERGNECGSELEAPGDVASVFDDYVGAETEEDTYEFSD